MSSEVPKITLNLAGESFEATPDNSSLFMHLGALACYNHVFLERGEADEGTLTGTYLFSVTPVFDELAAFMVANGYPMHVNLRDVARCDVEAFDRMIAQQMDDIDHIPDEWDNGPAES